MTVNIEYAYRATLTSEEIQAANRIISNMLETEHTATYYVEQAINVIGKGEDFCEQVIVASAKIAKNTRAWNSYHEASKDLDIWIGGIARAYDTFYVIGFYFSDLWNICMDNYDEVIQRFRIQKFKEVNSKAQDPKLRS